MQRRFHPTFTSLFLAACLLLVWLLAPCPARAREREQILMLNSYHQNFNWNEGIFRGVTEVLRPRETGLTLHVEYMDTKRVEFNAQYEKQLRDVYAHKYAGMALDLIMVTDNNAFDFMRRHHEELFPTVPVVFCGVGFLREELLRDQPLFTGVAEPVGARATLEWALRLHPGTRNVFVINDFTPTGQAMAMAIREQLKGLDPAVTVECCANEGLNGLLERIDGLPKDSLVLMGVFNRDVNGNFYDVAEASTAVTRRAKVPVYGLIESDLGHGIVGGLLLSGVDQGRSMAQLALHVLAGRSPSEIPVIQPETWVPKFDFDQLRRFDISLTELPENSVIINRPRSFYSEHFGLFLLGLSFGVIQFLIIVALIVNISRRRQAEKALMGAQRTLEARVEERTRKLRDSEEALRTVFDSSTDAILIHDIDGNIMEVNRRTIEMFSLDGVDLSRATLDDNVSTPDNPLYRDPAVLKEVLAGRPQNFEWRYRRPGDGREVDVEVYLTRIVYRGRAAILNNIRDISVRKEAENHIRQSLTKFEAILDNTLMGIAMSLGRKLVTINRRGAEIFGYTPEEIMGSSVDLLLGHYQTQDEFVGAAKSALLERGEFNAEQAFRSKNGSTVWCRMYAKAVDTDDLDKGVIWAWDDVTDNRKAQEDLLRTREDAEAANRAKSEFLAAMSHEIRTPMNAIVGMTEITLQTDLTGDQRDYLRTVKDSAQHLLSIINDILDLSKIEARKLELDCVDFDLFYHVSTTIKGLEVQARQKGLDMFLQIDDRVQACVKGDPLSLRQVLVNLVGNAVKFTHRGAITIRVLPAPPTMQAEGDSRTLGVAFEVEDTGIGIPREFLSTIFQSFSQSTRAFGGTGLGLAICKQLIALMGGDIRVESTVGKGRRFFFTIWFQPGVSCPVPAADRRLPDAPPRPVRVLVAEDNEVNVMVTTLKLEDMGYTYAVAGTGLEVLELLKRESFDLVLMDIEMPVLDGISTTKAIRSAVPGGPIPDPAIPIIGVTAHALKEFRDQSLAAGMDDYVAKPVDFHELALIINRLIGPGPTPAARQETAPPPETDESPAQPDPTRTWDPQGAMDRLGVDRETFSGFLAASRVELAILAEELRQAFQAGNPGKGVDLARTVRSVCTAVGADSTALAAAALREALLTRQDPTNPHARLETEIENLLKIMDRRDGHF